jgi:methyltransferase (TIGR00027 family)
MLQPRYDRQMIEGRASLTAERVAVERAAHQLLDTPLVLVDPLALRVIAPEAEASLREHPERHDASPIAKPTRALAVVRSRIAEDEIAAAAAAGTAQYVILGAGLDTFAYRNPHGGVRVFEVDHPATQQMKRQRLASAGIEIPSSVTFVPCDFSTQSAAERLGSAGFDTTRPAVFAWLGVVMYLDRADAMKTLRDIAALPRGTSVIFDYALPLSAVPGIAGWFYRRVLARLAAQGESWRSFLEPQPLAAELAALGFRSVEDLGAEEIDRRYLADRRDGLKAGRVGRIAIARR